MEEQSPVLNQISGVILWSRNLERSVELYNKLFRLSPEQQKGFGHLYIFHLPSGMDVMIDANGMDAVPVPDKAPPLFFMPATDIDKAAAFVQELGFEIIYGGIHRNDAVSFFNMRDPDFNVITVCQNHR